MGSDARRAAEIQKRITTKDEFGAIRFGEGKGIHKTELPLGAIVVRMKNGVPARFVKVRMGGKSGRRWIQYGKWWWEKNNGPVPDGQLVLHKDGDAMNDHPSNFTIGTPGTKLALRHARDPEWSKLQHESAAAACGEWNRRQGRINRSRNFLKYYWYPVVDEMGVILNVPFRRRKRLLACFGADVSEYPNNGIGRKSSSGVQKALRTSHVRPVRSEELSNRCYSTYCLSDPASRSFRGPMGHSEDQVVRQLERMNIWPAAERYAKKDLKERK